MAAKPEPLPDPKDFLAQMQPGVAEFAAYAIDAWQRSWLLLDVLCERGDEHVRRSEMDVPHVLTFDVEMVMDGRQLDRPVNYGLVRVRPPEGVKIDETKRPFIVVDPRAGHGPGIGGFKPDSEIGMALRAGHPCYFIGFTPMPMPGQTTPDVIHAEGVFVAKVAELHPDAPGRPVVIGNCQAGWQTIALATAAPDVTGPIIVAGSPLSYWAGEEGKNPMRYTGGLIGGSWFNAMLCDLGNGKFDGAWLVSNFDNLNPANTFFDKEYNVYSKVDTERDRFLEFEKWWTTFYLMNEAEIMTIVNDLFVGNKLTAGSITTRDGYPLDIRNIRSPIVVFCSWGDNITPPPQALHWILDVYESLDEIRAHGQTIIYALHDTIGHLGIFVSGSIAKKEHKEFIANIDLIDSLPPGLYEAVFTDHDTSGNGSKYVAGNFEISFEGRNLDDIRKIATLTEEDEHRFNTVARLSEISEGLYRTMASPTIRSMVDENLAQWLRQMHPLRARYRYFSSRNPMMAMVPAMASLAREHRQPVAADNPFLALQSMMAETISNSLNAYRDMRDRMNERMFQAIYSSPVMQAAVGYGPHNRKRGKVRNAAQEALLAQKLQGVLMTVAKGGSLEALVRSIVLIALSEKRASEAGFGALTSVLARMPEEDRPDFARLRQTIRDQFRIVVMDEAKALATLPGLAAAGPMDKAKIVEAIRYVMEAQRREFSKETMQRAEQVIALIEGEGEGAAPAPVSDGGLASVSDADPSGDAAAADARPTRSRAKAS